MHRIFGKRGPLAVTALGDHEHVAALDHRRHARDRVALAELDPDHALGVATHGADLSLAETNRLAELSCDDDLILPVVGVTQSSSSSSWRLMAISPLRRTFAYSAIAVFFIYPFFVTISM